MRSFNKQEYSAIVFDEVTPEQVLCNRLLFQSVPWPVFLGESACDQHLYTLDVYAVPMILCSNDFKLRVDEGVGKEDSDWLCSNIHEAAVPLPSMRWYV